MGRIFLCHALFFFSFFFQGRQTDYLQRRLSVARILAGLTTRAIGLLRVCIVQLQQKEKDHGNEKCLLEIFSSVCGPVFFAVFLSLVT